MRGLIHIGGSLACMFLTTAAFAEDNCSDVQQDLTNTYEVVFWGSCYKPTEQDAKYEGTQKCVDLFNAGALPEDIGARVIKNWIMYGKFKIPLTDTYMGFCYGKKASGIKLPSADEARSIIEKALRELEQKGR